MATNATIRTILKFRMNTSLLEYQLLDDHCANHERMRLAEVTELARRIETARIKLATIERA